MHEVVSGRIADIFDAVASGAAADLNPNREAKSFVAISENYSQDLPVAPNKDEVNRAFDAAL